MMTESPLLKNQTKITTTESPCMKNYDDGVPFSKNINRSSCMGRIFSSSMSVRGGFLVRQALHETYFCLVSACMGHIFGASVTAWSIFLMRQFRIMTKR